MRARIVFACALVAGLGAIAWQVLARREPGLHGKPESFWINSLTNAFTFADFATWRALGPERVPILLKALEKQPGPVERSYAKLLPKLPAFLQTRLPVPADYAGIRHGASFMLGLPEPGTKIPLLPLTRAFTDQDWGVRMNVLCCFYYVVLPNSGMADREQILSLLLAAAHDSKLEVRMSAVACLDLYKDQPERVIPVLTKALADDDPDVRIRAAMSLNKIDPAIAEKAGAVAVASDCLDSDGLFGSRALATEFLQELGKLPPDEGK